ncbi:MAG: hypothetical protein ACJ76Y_15575 [Thermoanaerobaculia bacterium]
MTFLTSIWKAGLLWPVVKFVLSELGWYALFRAVAKIVEIFLLPEAEAVDLLVSFTVWAAKTIEAAVDVGHACSKGYEGLGE